MFLFVEYIVEQEEWDKRFGLYIDNCIIFCKKKICAYKDIVSFFRKLLFRTFKYTLPSTYTLCHIFIPNLHIMIG